MLNKLKQMLIILMSPVLFGAMLTVAISRNYGLNPIGPFIGYIVVWLYIWDKCIIAKLDG